jgi:hypothetical protein
VRFRAPLQRNNYSKLIVVSLGILLLSGCKMTIPKPVSYPRLDYPVAKYANFENDCPFTFEMNSDEVIKGGKLHFTILHPK